MKIADVISHMKKISRAALFFAATLPLAGRLQAAPAYEYTRTTVKWVTEHKDDFSQDNRFITLVGRVTGRLGDETYLFTDGTGTIRLDSEKFELPPNQPIVITGRIDEAWFGFGHLEVDVRHWHFVNKPTHGKH